MQTALGISSRVAVAPRVRGQGGDVQQAVVARAHARSKKNTFCRAEASCVQVGLPTSLHANKGASMFVQMCNVFDKA